MQWNKSDFWNKAMLQLLVAPSMINLGWPLSLMAAPPEQWNISHGISSLSNSKFRQFLGGIPFMYREEFKNYFHHKNIKLFWGTMLTTSVLTRLHIRDNICFFKRVMHYLCKWKCCQLGLVVAFKRGTHLPSYQIWNID